MKNIIIRAPLLTYSGYGTHSRQIFRWLLERHGNCNIFTSVVPWGITPWMVNPDLSNGLVAEIMGRSSNPPAKCDISIQVQLPNEWDPGLAKFNVGVSAVVETDICNPEWINACNRMDCIIVPSNHVKNVIQASGECTTPIHVVHESFYDDIAKSDLEPLQLDIDTDFNFLIVGQVTGNNPRNDRKNTFNAIKWICEEFKDDPNVGIVLKTNSGRNTRIDRKITERLVSQLLSEVRPGPYPKVHLLHGALSDNEMARLYLNKRVKALVSLTRGEGFGLPILEAAASGLPVIATSWSGHLDFLRLGKYISVNYELKQVDQSRVDNSIFMEGSRWAEASESHAKARLKKFRDRPDIPQTWAASLREKLLTSFSQKNICDEYDKVLGEFLR